MKKAYYGILLIILVSLVSCSDYFKKYEQRRKMQEKQKQEYLSKLEQIPFELFEKPDAVKYYIQSRKLLPHLENILENIDNYNSYINPIPIETHYKRNTNSLKYSYILIDGISDWFPEETNPLALLEAKYKIYKKAKSLKAAEIINAKTKASFQIGSLSSDYMRYYITGLAVVPKNKDK